MYCCHGEIWNSVGIVTVSGEAVPHIEDPGPPGWNLKVREYTVSWK